MGIMPMKKAPVKVPLVIAAAVRPVSARLSRMEDLLFEMRREQDVKLRKINKLQAAIDVMMEGLQRRRVLR
jgi:hypothetical protein